MGAPSAEPPQAEMPAAEPSVDVAHGHQPPGAIPNVGLSGNQPNQPKRPVEVSDDATAIDVPVSRKPDVPATRKPKRKTGINHVKVAEGERNRAAILGYLVSAGPSLATEIAGGLNGVDESAIRDHLRRMLDEGRVHITATKRRAKGDVRTGGRLPAEYAAGPGTPVDVVRDLPQPPPAPAADQDDDLQAIVNKVRSTIVRFEDDKMTIGQIAEISGVSKIGVVAVMGQLVATGSVKKSRPPGAKEDLYNYTKSSRGAAPTTKANDKGPRVIREPVAGTGRPKQAGNQAVNELIAAARRAGARVEPSGSGHWAVFCPNGRVLIPSTPSNPRSLLTAKSRLRTAGLVLA